MLSSFADPANFPFLVALVIVFILALTEGVAMLVGAGVFAFLDGLLPDIDLGVELDMDVDIPDLETPSLTGQVLSWLRIGQVPVIFSLIVFLVSFGMIGLTLQSLSYGIFGKPAPISIAMTVTFFLSMPLLRFGNYGLAAVMPRDETSAVSRDSLIGEIATLTLGEARKDYPAQAKVKDEFGRVHYVMLAPDNKEETFVVGDQIRIVRSENNIYYGVKSAWKPEWVAGQKR